MRKETIVPYANIVAPGQSTYLRILIISYTICYQEDKSRPTLLEASEAHRWNVSMCRLI